MISKTWKGMGMTLLKPVALESSLAKYLTPWNRILLHVIVVAQLAKKFRAFYWTWKVFHFKVYLNIILPLRHPRHFFSSDFD
jgi:hypothetical protein